MVAEAFRDLLPDGGRRELTPDEIAEVEDVLDASAEWRAGRLPWQAAANIGTIARGSRPSSSYARFVALNNVSRTDPRRDDLLALMDHLDRAQGLTITDGGTMTQRDITDLRASAETMRRFA